MKPRAYPAIAGLFLRRIAVGGLALLIVTAAVCWLGGWRTLHAFGGGLVWAGIAAIIAGAISVVVGLDIVSDRDYQSLRSIQRDNVRTYHASDRDYLDGRAVILVQLLIVGVGLIALGELVEAVAR